MSKVNEALVRKALGILQSIEKMGQDKMGGYPSKDFGEDVNLLLDKARENNPEIADILPANVDFYEGDFDSGTYITYSEIHSKLNQVYQMLSE